MATRTSSKVTTDHEEIRRWAEERGAQPACVRGTGDEGDIGMLRLEFPGAPGAHDESLQPISWDDWFRKFDERGLALLYQDETARGQKSNFNKIIARETAEAREEGDTKASRHHPGRRGRTGKRVAVAAVASRSRSNARGKSAKSASRKSSSGTRAASSRKKTTKAASGTRSSGRKSQTRATASTKRSSSQKSASSKSGGNVRSISSGRGSARSGRTASARGREGGRSNRRAA